MGYDSRKGVINMIDQINTRLRQLHEVAPGSIGDRLGLEPLEYDEVRKECLMRCKTESWMRNGQDDNRTFQKSCRSNS